MKKFDIPSFYRSAVISKIKETRKAEDPKKKDFSPAVLDFSQVRIIIARHFGFCYGVENAIEIAYRTLEENPGRRIFLLSEMIHNPGVNQDLISRGVAFLMDTSGKHIFNWDELTPEDIVIIPAFGTTLEIQAQLSSKGIDVYRYNTTCPFVEKVWNRSAQLGAADYTIIIHGKHTHEETKATYSHSITKAPSVIVRDIAEAELLADIILHKRNSSDFFELFKGKFSDNFNVDKDLQRVGVVNQTTMLASETQAIADCIKNAMISRYGSDKLKEHFADTRDTLCYATNDNQQATYAMLEHPADFAVVVGGYNSSNTTHLVELCEEKIKTFFISSEEKILSEKLISHFDIHSKKEVITENFIPRKDVVDILLTSGASCPDAVVDAVIKKLVSFFDNAADIEEVIVRS